MNHDMEWNEMENKGYLYPAVTLAFHSQVDCGIYTPFLNKADIFSIVFHCKVGQFHGRITSRRAPSEMYSSSVVVPNRIVLMTHEMYF